MIEQINRSVTWSAPSQTLIKCPVPGCEHVTNNIITKAHCRLEHGMERAEVKALHGMPIILRKRGKTIW